MRRHVTHHDVGLDDAGIIAHRLDEKDLGIKKDSLVKCARNDEEANPWLPTSP